MTTATATPQSSPATFSRKQQFLDTFVREHETTVKLLRAFPASQADFKPAERSSTARHLAWTFVMEQGLMLGAITGTLKIGGSKFPPAPESYDAIVQKFESDFEKVRSLLEATTDETLSETVQFFTGPKQLGDVPKMQVLWFALCDQIHHRGQLSVYVRMNGGKVPSIYGPSGDEPWM
jgi:uncharacterized damage-inducible protein DinB